MDGAKNVRRYFDGTHKWNCLFGLILFENRSMERVIKELGKNISTS